MLTQSQSVMFRISILTGIFTVPMCLCSLPAAANSGTGEMVVGVIDPTDLSYDEARRLCEQEPDMIKCDIVEEIAAQEREDDFVPIAHANDNYLEDNVEVTYSIFNANYE